MNRMAGTNTVSLETVARQRDPTQGGFAQKSANESPHPPRRLEKRISRWRATRCPPAFIFRFSSARRKPTRAEKLKNFYHSPPLNKSNHFVKMTINVDSLPISFVAIASCSALLSA
jgi:hypothetical protein